MRIGWGLPLPGPFYVSGTARRRREPGGCLTVVIVLGIAAVVVGTHGWALVAAGVLMVIGAAATIRQRQQARRARQLHTTVTPGRTRPGRRYR